MANWAKVIGNPVSAPASEEQILNLLVIPPAGHKGKSRRAEAAGQGQREDLVSQRPHQAAQDAARLQVHGMDAGPAFLAVQPRRVAAKTGDDPAAAHESNPGAKQRPRVQPGNLATASKRPPTMRPTSP